jgi:hypothetical protein
MLGAGRKRIGIAIAARVRERRFAVPLVLFTK